jgi:hypothetical protein
MTSTMRVLVALAGAALLAGCGAGRNFKMPAEDQLKLGVTTPQDAVAMFGQPLSQASQTQTEVAKSSEPETVFTAVPQPGTYVGYSYIFVDTTGQQWVGRLAGLRPERFLRLVFYDGKLAGYLSTSSFKDDSTDFDNSRVSQIIRDKSTAADVIALMGKPTGGAIFPLISPREGHSLTYYYLEDNLQANTHRTKFLNIYFDAQNIVRDIQSSDSTSPLPIAPAAGGPVVVPIIVPHGR